MDNKWSGLASTVMKFKESLKDELDSTNKEFHTAINGEEPIQFNGLSTEDDTREYRVEVCGMLFWHDPIAYLDELERWQGQLLSEKHTEVRNYLIETRQIKVFSKLVESLKKKRIV